MSAVDLQRQIDELRRQLDYLTSLEMTGLFGTYTPTLTNSTNVDGSTAYVCGYSRVGSAVHVFGRVDIDATTAGALTRLDMSLPIASALANAGELAGTFANGNNGGNSAGQIKGNTTDDRAIFNIYPFANTDTEYYFTFSYQII